MSRHMTIAAVACVSAAALLVACDRTSDGKAQAAPASGASSATPSAVSPQAGGQQLPPEVGQWVQKVRRECTEAGGRWAGISNFILRGDFNGDGSVDYVLQWGGADCPHPQSFSAFGWGNAGPKNDFLISQPGGSYRLFDGFLAEFGQESIVRLGNRDVLAFEGTWSEPGGEIHKIIRGWTGRGIDIVERQDAHGRPVDARGYPVRSAPATTPSTGSRPAASGGNFPPLPKGFYAVNSSCAEAARSIDGNYVYFTEKKWQETDGGSDIRSIEAVGSNSWRLRTTDGNSLMLRTTGPSSFTENGRRFQHCPDSTVPASVRPYYVGNG